MAKKKDSNTELSQNLRQLPVEVEAKAWGEVVCLFSYARHNSAGSDQPDLVGSECPYQ